MESVPPAKSGAGDVGAAAIEVVIVFAALVYVASGTPAALVTWELLTFGYLVVGFTILRARAEAGGTTKARRGFLDALSWVLPLIASIVGIYSAILALVARSASASSGPRETFLSVAASIGVILAWILLQIGFAQIYASTQNRAATPSLTFPKQPNPTSIDFLYFSFTIGTSFATSDAEVVTPTMRLTVVCHSVISFFYNALVVAVAFQVLQQAVVN